MPVDPGTPTDSPLTKEPKYTLSTADIPSTLDQQNLYSKNQIYSSDSYPKQDYSKLTDSRNDLAPRSDFNSPERRADSAERNLQHKRQMSTLHGNYNYSKGMMDQSPAKEGVYGQVPDLPPRVDRAIKPMGLLTTPGKIPNG